MDPMIKNDEDNDCKITIINNDCLAHIFSFLSQKELIKIERVCKWWQCVSLESWSMIKKVNTEEIIGWNSVRSDKPLKCILKRCGPYVKYLTVDLDHSDLKVISKYCADLHSLEVFNFYLHKKIRDSSAFRHMEELKIFGGKVTDKRVQHLFELCPNIQSITISNVWDSFGQFEIPRSLERLEIISCNNFHMENIVANFGSMKNLKSLSIDASKDQVNEQQFIRTIESLPNLEHLRFSGCRDYFSYLTLSPTQISKRLISLNVHDNSYISDDLLERVAVECVNLEYLNISGCNKVTTDGVCELVKLPRLKYLTLCFKKWVHDWENVTDEELEKFAVRGKLVKLKIRQNKKITDRGCSKILSLCDELEHFDISGCSLITDATIVAAETALKYRTNNKKLKLLVGGTSVSNIEKWQNNVTPLLVVHDKYSKSSRIDPELLEENRRCCFGSDLGYYIPLNDEKRPDIDILESDSDSDESTNGGEFNKSNCSWWSSHSRSFFLSSEDSDY